MFKGLLCAGFVLLACCPMATAQAEGPNWLLLTELYYDTPGVDREEEWIELANLGQSAVSLSDYKVGDEESPGGGEGMVRFPEGSVLDPGQVIVVAQTARGFRHLFGFSPDYEIQETDQNVPDMRPFPAWATGDFALANDGDELLLLDEQNLVIDSLNYGDRTSFFSPPVAGVYTGLSIARVPANCDTDSAADWQPAPEPSPGQISYDGECTALASPLDQASLLPIGEIQGDTDVSPYVNQIVTFRGVVTGSYEDRNTRGVVFYILFLQELPGNEDGDPRTSDGIALFLGLRPAAARIGDQVRVTGTVTEYFGFTEIDDDGLQIAVEAASTMLPAPIRLALPEDSASAGAYLETLESMRVTLPGSALVAGPTHEGCEFYLLHPDAPQMRAFQRIAGVANRALIPVRHNTDVDCAGFPGVKSGDSVAGATGPLMYSFDRFRIVHQDPSDLAVTVAPLPNIPPPALPADGQFSVATFNLQDHFDSMGDEALPDAPQRNPAEVAAKQHKLAHVIAVSLGCPTLLGIQEVENAALLSALAGELAVACGFEYGIYHRDSPDARGLDLALMAKPGDVVVTGVELRQTCTPDNYRIQDDSMACPDGRYPLFSRPPLQVQLEIKSKPYLVLVNHFKSKREGEAETAQRRLAQATYVRSLADSWLASDQRARIIVMGDFNDFENSAVMRLMIGGAPSLANALQRVPDAQRYSYIYGGMAQLIDGILVSPELKDLLVSSSIVHANADFPFTFGGSEEPMLLPYRSSDHDIPMVILSDGIPNATTPESAVTTSAPVPAIAPTSTPERAEATAVASATAQREARRPESGQSDMIFCFAALLTLVSLLLWRRRRI